MTIFAINGDNQQLTYYDCMFFYNKLLFISQNSHFLVCPLYV